MMLGLEITVVQNNTKYARMRALENNIPLIRVSNNGISAKISKNGKIEEYIPLNKRVF